MFMTLVTIPVFTDAGMSFIGLVLTPTEN